MSSDDKPIEEWTEKDFREADKRIHKAIEKDHREIRAIMKKCNIPERFLAELHLPICPKCKMSSIILHERGCILECEICKLRFKITPEGKVEILK